MENEFTAPGHVLIAGPGSTPAPDPLMMAAIKLWQTEALMTWTLSEAEGRLGEVLTRADVEAQIIVRTDREYVLLSADEYRRLKGQEPSFTDFLTDVGPRFDDLELPNRPAVTMRDAEL